METSVVTLAWCPLSREEIGNLLCAKEEDDDGKIRNVFSKEFLYLVSFFLKKQKTLEKREKGYVLFLELLSYNFA